jgi:hypothetical protein
VAQCLAVKSAYFEAVSMINISNAPKMTSLIVSLAVAMFASFACSAGPNEISVAETAQATTDQEIPAAKKKLQPMEQIAFAQQDLANRLDIGKETIKVSGATPVTWRSGALGCPKPGVSYTDVLVPGIWIVLRVDKATYRYHAVPGGQPFYCPEDRAEPPVMGSGAD